jgi:serine/threonine-protein kinase HipA
MELARAIGLDVPQCGIIEGKVPLFIIERYDRYRDEKGRFHRMHQQDFCQALGYTSEEKYESIGGPSLKQCFDLIKNHVSAKERIAAIQRFIDWICFNLFIGNNDSHAKNISLIQRSGTNSLAPFYDLLSTEIYPTLGKKFAFVIGDPRIVGQLGKSQFLKLENQLQVKEGAILKRMKKIGDAILSHKGRLVQDVEKKLPNSTIQKKISRFIEERYQGFQYHRIVP